MFSERQDRDWRFAQHALGHTAQESVTQARATMRRDHDQVRTKLARGLENGTRRIATLERCLILGPVGQMFGRKLLQARPRGHSGKNASTGCSDGSNGSLTTVADAAPRGIHGRAARQNPRRAAEAESKSTGQRIFLNLIFIAFLFQISREPRAMVIEAAG